MAQPDPDVILVRALSRAQHKLGRGGSAQVGKDFNKELVDHPVTREALRKTKVDGQIVEAAAAGDVDEFTRLAHLIALELF